MHLRMAWLAATAFFFSSAAADEVVLKNGDRISGEIASKSTDVVVVRTDYAGEVSIRWSEIATLSTTRAVEVLLEGDAEPVRGTLHPVYGGGALLVDTQGNERRVTLEQIAYLNPEPHQIDGRVAYSGRATLAANYASGNVESERVYAEADFKARAKDYRYSLTGRSERRTEPPLGTVTSWLTAANYDRFLREKEFIYGRASLEHDEAKSIEQRAALGGGYGVQIFDTERIRLSVRGGLDYVAVDRIGAENDRYPAAGWGVRLDTAPWGPKLELFHEQEGYWNLEDSDVVTLRSKTGVRVPLVAKLNATAQVNVDWERSPTPPRASTDKVLLLGVDYTW
jgi:hypothetical protein